MVDLAWNTQCDILRKTSHTHHIWTGNGKSRDDNRRFLLIIAPLCWVGGGAVWCVLYLRKFYLAINDIIENIYTLSWSYRQSYMYKLHICIARCNTNDIELIFSANIYAKRNRRIAHIQHCAYSTIQHWCVYALTPRRCLCGEPASMLDCMK